MASGRKILLGCLGACAGLGSACVDPYEFRLPPTDLHYEGEHIRLFAEPDIVPCVGTGPTMDRFFDFLAEEFGQGPMSELVDVHWISSESYDEFSICDSVPMSSGCFITNENIVVTKGAVTEHELVHAYFNDRASGRPPSFFEEGIATNYGRETYIPPPWTSIEDGLSQTGGIATEHYPRAGHFMAFVLEEFGPEQAGKFMVALAGVSTEDAGGVFETVLGEPLDDFVELYKEESVTCDSEGWNRPPECSADPIPFFTDSQWRHRFDVSCEDVDTIGQIGGTIIQRAPLNLTSDGSYNFLFELGIENEGGPPPPSDGYSVALVGCGGCGSPFHFDLETDSPADGIYLLPLDAGQYYVQVTRRAEDAIVDDGLTVIITRNL